MCELKMIRAANSATVTTNTQRALYLLPGGEGGMRASNCLRQWRHIRTRSEANSKGLSRSDRPFRMRLNVQ